MKKHLAIAVAAAVVLTSTAAFATDIPVKRVILSTSGLANFELGAHVNGNTALAFPVRLEQVDDILKSLVIFDDKGRLGGVTLPGKQPLAQTFRDLPFSQHQLKNPMLLLNAYQGAQITVTEAGASVTGKVLHVEPFTTVIQDNASVTKHMISLMTDAGMRQIVLEDAQGVQFEDEKVRAEIMRALAAIRENGTLAQRTITVNLLGKGARDVALSYVVDAPLWKAAYRMVLPENGKDSGLLQGWAVVENMTATDWQDVDLTLVSGNPVTYKQSLYESYYVDRPEIPVEVFGRVMPRVDTGGIMSDDILEEAELDSNMMFHSKNQKRARRMQAKSTMAAAPMEALSQSIGGARSYDAPAVRPVTPAALARAANAAQSSEATTQVLFRFPDTFSLKSGQSMMLPFVSRNIPMERVYLYQQDTHPTHPLAAVRLKNDDETGLPPGILTLYEQNAAIKGTGFVGDAQLPVFAAGEDRMVSYALDSKTTINREDKSLSTEGRIVISKGVIKTETLRRAETVYTIKAPAREDRTVIIEHPKMHDYKLVLPDPKNAETTQTHYRIRVPVTAGKAKKATVAMEQTYWQSYNITNLPLQQLIAYATSRGELSPAVRREFEKLAEVRRAIDSIDTQLRDLRQEKNTIFRDQERVRENLKSLSGKSDIQQKYLGKLSDQEDTITKLDTTIKTLTAQRAALQEKLGRMAAEIRL
ncbi:MAG: DUF4139 domain-containing protein [Alphaproteobacteria bacterium]|nr:DUF4139 domain-containing protein [Alphaproteobacteria bacterium]